VKTFKGKYISFFLFTVKTALGVMIQCDERVIFTSEGWVAKERDGWLSKRDGWLSKRDGWLSRGMGG
jgi:hypothetical protein